MANLFARKPLDKLMAEAADVGEHSLKRSLGAWNLIALGIGGIIGAGLFVRTAAAIAERAGPSVVLAFMVAGVGCAFAGLCYAEFASMIPVAGSAYTYSYATMGEFVAWIIGWDLILEYAVAAATVASAWSEYANRVLDWFGWRIPYQWSHTPFQHDAAGVAGIVNLPAVFILFLLTLLLIRGTKESAFVNGLIVVLKVSIVILVIGLGWGYINSANHTPFIPAPTTYTTAEGITHPFGGIMGILGAAGVVLCLHRVRRRLDRRARSEKSKTRYADRHPGVARHLHHSLRPFLICAQRHRAGRRLPRSPAWRRSIRCVCDQHLHARIRMAFEMRDGRDSRGIFFRHPGDVAWPIARFLFHEPRWFGSADFFGRPPALPHAL
jgi:hypothetical protein